MMNEKRIDENTQGLDQDTRIEEDTNLINAGLKDAPEGDSNKDMETALEQQPVDEAEAAQEQEAPEVPEATSQEAKAEGQSGEGNVGNDDKEIEETTNLINAGLKDAPEPDSKENFTPLAEEGDEEGATQSSEVEKVAETEKVVEAPVEEKPEEEMTMEELMNKYDNPVRVGQIITGKVIQLDDKEAIIALVGSGNDGKLAVSEVEFDDNAKLSETLQLGEEVRAKVIRRPIENDSFYILSVKELEREASKNELLDIMGKDETIRVRVKEAVKGGLVAYYKGHRIFIPASHVDLHSVRDLSEYVGQEIDINVIEAEERRGSTRIVGSRKKHLKKEQAKLQEQTWTELEEGQVTTGVVQRLVDFGAFISIRGVDGLLHISEITHGKIPKPSSVLSQGQEVEVKITRLDKENKRMSLSMKALAEDPWTNIAEKYPNNSIVLGKVVRFTDFGAFIELEPGIDGLAHISQLSHTRVEKPSDVLNIGDTIKVMVLETNEADRKVSLSVKAVEE